MKATKKQNEKIVRDVIKKYGTTIDLKQSPFVLIEIIRQYSKLFLLPDDGGLPPGGVGVGGPIVFGDIGNSEILKEVFKISREVRVIRKKLEK